MEVPIHKGSPLDGLQIKDFHWPGHCLIVSVKRGSQELIPAGDITIQAGDYLTVLTDDIYASRVRQKLHQASVSSVF